MNSSDSTTDNGDTDANTEGQMARVIALDSCLPAAVVRLTAHFSLTLRLDDSYFAKLIV